MLTNFKSSSINLSEISATFSSDRALLILDRLQNSETLLEMIWANYCVLLMNYRELIVFCYQEMAYLRLFLHALLTNILTLFFFSFHDTNHKLTPDEIEC